MLCDTWSSIETAYASPLAQWDNRAMVRRRISTSGQAIDAATGFFFKPELVPALWHPTVRGMGANIAQQLQALHLYRYLDYTEILELQIVNVALLEIIKAGFPRALKHDAYKVYTDEGYHALMALELQQQIEAQTGIQRIELPFPSSIDKTRRHVESLPPRLQGHGLIAAAAVNEMLISANLAQADDPALIPVVRSMIHDHAIDEAVHSLFFSKVFIHLWTGLADDSKIHIGKLLPAFIKTFLEVDIASIACDLMHIGLSECEARDIAISAHKTAGDADKGKAARSAITTFERANVFAMPELREGFRACRLID